MRTSLTKETAASTLALLRDEIAALTLKPDFDDSDATAIAAKAELCSVILRRVESGKRTKRTPTVREEYIDMNEMCDIFGVSKKTIYTRIAVGDIPKPMKHGKANIWDRKEIQNNIAHAKFTN
jgi:predicted DNA-binding transcriptional regulator AlpA